MVYRVYFVFQQDNNETILNGTKVKFQGSCFLTARVPGHVEISPYFLLVLKSRVHNA